MSEELNLFNLDFTDLFVAKNPSKSWYKESTDSLQAKKLPQSCLLDVEELRKLLLEHPEDDHDFSLTYDGIKMRVERMDTHDGSIFVCRRYRVAPKCLADLGFPQMIASRLMSDKPKQMIRDGLVLFTGRTGSGKSTTAAAYIIERLKKFGGVCWTVENPIELSIQGDHGKGVCYQTEVPSDRFGASVRRILRAAPNIIMLGEIRDSDSAVEALRAATSGHLVVTTLHANDVISGLSRLSRLAGGNEDMQEAIRAVIHLDLRSRERITKISPEDEWSSMPDRVLQVDPLIISQDGDFGIRSQLKETDFSQLKSEVERQKRMFMAGGFP